MNITHLGATTVGAAGSDPNVDWVSPPVLAGDLLILTSTARLTLLTGAWENQGAMDQMAIYSQFVGVTPPGGVLTGSAVYEPVGGIPFLYRGILIQAYRGVQAILSVLTSPAIPFTSNDVPVPVPAGQFQGGLGAVEVGSGTIAGAPGDDVTGHWRNANLIVRPRRSIRQYSYVSPDPTLPLPEGLFHIEGSELITYGWMAGVSLVPDETIPVVRQYPRDSKGLAAGRRLYPPPRGNRLVGGHQ